MAAKKSDGLLEVIASICDWVSTFDNHRDKRCEATEAGAASLMTQAFRGCDKRRPFRIRDTFKEALDFEGINGGDLCTIGTPHGYTQGISQPFIVFD